MTYTLDTNTLIALFNHRTPSLMGRLKAHHPSEIVISSIVMHELYFGAFKSHRVANNLKLVNTLPFETITFDKEDSLCAGEIRTKLEALDSRICVLDTLIAGQAKTRGFTMVTNNVRELSCVEGLKLEDWLMA